MLIGEYQQQQNMEIRDIAKIFHPWITGGDTVYLFCYAHTHTHTHTHTHPPSPLQCHGP